ncbi:sirtuin 2 [Tanacetum coccineum]
MQVWVRVEFLDTIIKWAMFGWRLETAFAKQLISKGYKQFLGFKWHFKELENLAKLSLNSVRKVLSSLMTDVIHPASKYKIFRGEATSLSFLGSVNKKLVVLTGAGISTECGIPDYRRNLLVLALQDARYSGGENYPVWKKFKEAVPGRAHTALASLEKANRISLMITQNMNRVVHHAGCSPFELHGTVHISLNSVRKVLSSLMTDVIHPASKYKIFRGEATSLSFLGSVKYAHTMSASETTTVSLKDRKVVPDSEPLRVKDVNLLHDFFDKSKKLVVLTGAGISTECGIPDYRSPNGAYSTGFRPITHQEFTCSSTARRRYWARNYPVWKKFKEAVPGRAHTALASLEKANRISLMITQNIDRLHHRAGSSPIELHGTVHIVTCLNCGFSISRESFQDQLNSLNPKWAAALESLACDSNLDECFGIKHRPDGDIEIDENFWEDKLHIPTCSICDAALKPDVVFFGDNIPTSRLNMAVEAAEGCDSFLVLGSSLTTMFPFDLVRIAGEAGAATAIVNIGATEADDIVDLKIDAQVGEILPPVLERLGVPEDISDLEQNKC